MNLSGKVVFVTDADSASGRAVIRRFADEGARFILNSSSGGSAIEQELAICRTNGCRTIVVNIDLCSAAQVADMLAESANEIGSVDVLVHNNDLVEPGTIEHGTEAWFRRILNANAKSAFICTQAAGKVMADKNYGKIVYISSIHAEKPTASSFAYSASKGAVKMLCREASLKLGRHGVTVNAIEFGPVHGDDERFRSELSTLYEDYQYKVPNAELGTHDDLAELALFLATDRSRYINGSEIRMDGGFLMHYMDFKMKKP